MRNSKGITMVSLVSTIIVLFILTGIATMASLQAYDQMKYETFKAELEEIQREVDKISSDFQLAKENEATLTYEAYFKSRNSNNSPRTLGNASSESGVSDIKTKYGLSDSDYMFYFSGNDIKKYLGISGLDKSVIVDFSTKNVYSIEGCKNPDEGNDTKYYTLSEIGGAKTLTEKPTATQSTSSSITATNIKKTVGSTNMQIVTLNLERTTSGTGKNYNIKKAYYSKDGGTNWVEAEYLGDCKYSDTSVSFVVYEAGNYTFKVEDTSGKVLSSSSLSLTF